MAGKGCCVRDGRRGLFGMAEWEGCSGWQGRALFGMTEGVCSGWQNLGRVVSSEAGKLRSVDGGCAMSLDSSLCSE